MFWQWKKLRTATFTAKRFEVAGIKPRTSWLSANSANHWASTSAPTWYLLKKWHSCSWHLGIRGMLIVIIVRYGKMATRAWCIQVKLTVSKRLRWETNWAVWLSSFQPKTSIFFWNSFKLNANQVLVIGCKNSFANYYFVFLSKASLCKDWNIKKIQRLISSIRSYKGAKMLVVPHSSGKTMHN